MALKQENEFWRKEIASYKNFLKNNPGKKYEDFYPGKATYFVRFINIILNYLDVEKTKILEPGCGSGFCLCYLAKIGANVVGVDYSEYALELSRMISKEQGVKIKLLNKNMFSLPFKNNIFDLVFNSGVIEHLSKTKQIELLKEMVRCSKEYVAILIPNYSPDSAYTVFHRKARKYSRFYKVPDKPVNIEKLFQKTGIKLIYEDGINAIINVVPLEDMERYFGNKKIWYFIQNAIKRLPESKRDKIKDYPNMKISSKHINLLVKLEENYCTKEERMKYGFSRVYIGKIK